MRKISKMNQRELNRLFEYSKKKGSGRYVGLDLNLEQFVDKRRKRKIK